MKEFLTNQQAVEPPIISWWAQILVFSILIMISLLTVRYGHSKKFVRFFQVLQWIQLIGLNSWYLLMAFSWSFSLPLFHCRIAMWTNLLLPDNTRAKQYFALMGLSGAVLTFIYPVMDYYTFPHITAVSFILGHLALFANSLIYLYRVYDSHLLSSRQILAYTFVLNAFLLVVNSLTGGNYGILRSTPFISDQSLLVRYLAVSIVLTAVMLLVDLICRYFEKRSLERSATFSKISKSRDEPM